MVTLVVLGIILSVGVPASTDYIRTKASERVAMELEQDLKFARDTAARLVTDVEVRPFDTNTSDTTPGDWNTGWRVIQINNGQVLRAKGSAVEPVSGSATVSSSEFNASNPVRFDAQGRLVNATGGANTGSFRIQTKGCTGAQKTIEINFVGQVVVTEAAC
jgi:Tfp pilus assembly protein FimT